MAELWDALPEGEGSRYVIRRYRGPDTNLSTQFLRIIRRAGVEPWGRLFHNLRASRQTELANEFPAHVVCSWLGNSDAVAKDHYLQVTDEHFARARGGARVGRQVGQQPAATTCNNPPKATPHKALAQKPAIFPTL